MSPKEYTFTTFADVPTKLVVADRRARMIYNDLIASISMQQDSYRNSYAHIARKGAMYQIRKLVEDLVAVLQ